MPYQLPPADEELVWGYFKSSGPGGQHKNKTESGVRLTHLPSGITVTATERRSQFQNREAALERLIQRLTQLNRPRKTRKATRPTLASKKRRLKAKQRKGAIKRLRGRVSEGGLRLTSWKTGQPRHGIMCTSHYLTGHPSGQV
jgi:protein subunit release factor B